MLFSIPESGWWLIAVTATAFFMIGIRALPVGMRLPDELRRTIEQRSKRGKWMFYFLIPVLLAAVLGTNLLRPEPAPAILFLYSVVLASIPVALFPVRGRMLKDYITQQQNPDIKIKPDRLTMTWIAGFMSTVMLVAVLALMTTEYGMRSH